MIAVAVTILALIPRGGGDAAVSPMPTEVTPKSAQVPLIDVIGDSYVAGSSQGGYGDANWTRIVGSRFYAEHNPVDMMVSAHPSSGYLVRGVDKLTYEEAASRSLRTNTDLVIIFGSRNDGRKDQQKMEAAAKSLFSTVHQRSPHAQLIVVGPAWVNDKVPPFIRANSQTIARAAAQAGATFIDPLEQRWFFGVDTRFIGADGVHPTDEGHRYLAEKMYGIIARALALKGPSASPTTG